MRKLTKGEILAIFDNLTIKSRQTIKEIGLERYKNEVEKLKEIIRDEY